jgi:hypothetical protein
LFLHSSLAHSQRTLWWPQSCQERCTSQTFPKINKFNKDNALEFSSLLLNILKKYANQGPGLTDKGGVLSSLAKKIVPENEFVIYFQKLAEYEIDQTIFWNSTNSSNRRGSLSILLLPILPQPLNKVQPHRPSHSKNPVCKAKHKLFLCDDFKAMTTNKR